MDQYNVIILNFFLVITILFVSYPIEVKGYKSLDYSTGGLYKRPWQSFIPRKRMDPGAEKNESVYDGQVLFGDEDMVDTYKPIYYKHEAPIKDDDILFRSKKPLANKMRTRNYAQSGSAIKVLFGRVPGTLMFWPSPL